MLGWNFKKSKLNNYFLECGVELQGGFLQGLQLSGTMRMEHSAGQALSHSQLILERNIILGSFDSTAIVSTCIFPPDFPHNTTHYIHSLQHLTIAMGKLERSQFT